MDFFFEDMDSDPKSSDPVDLLDQRLDDVIDDDSNSFYLRDGKTIDVIVDCESATSIDSNNATILINLFSCLIVLISNIHFLLSFN